MAGTIISSSGESGDILRIFAVTDNVIFTFTYRSGRETQQFQGMCCIGSSKVIMVVHALYICVLPKVTLHLYIGSAMQTMNVHLLRHLVFNVRNWGPLWSYSCFGFESVNGELKKLFHGTRDMSQQVSLIQPYACQ